MKYHIYDISSNFPLKNPGNKTGGQRPAPSHGQRVEDFARYPGTVQTARYWQAIASSFRMAWASPEV
jgi:hypothetical protein